MQLHVIITNKDNHMATHRRDNRMFHSWIDETLESGVATK